MKIPLGLCQCGCGEKTKIATVTSARGGVVKGEPQRFFGNHHMPKHGMRYTPEYSAYRNAKHRCNAVNGKDYAAYGGRGIKFLFSNFQEFFKEIGTKPFPDYELDRIDNEGNYEPGNIHWAPKSVQMKNRRRWGKGYSWNTKDKRWVVIISFNDRLVYGGSFITEEEAKKARENFFKERGL